MTLRGQFRLLLFAFASALVMLGVTAVFLTADDTSASRPAGPYAVVVVLAGLLGTLVGPRLGPRLDCTDEATLIGTFRSRFFVRLAVAEAAALLGFVGSVITGAAWVYVLGAGFTAIGFARLAPTDGNLLRDEEALALSGCRISLRELLDRPLAPGSGF